MKSVAAVATCLSNTRVTDEEELKKKVVFVGVHGGLEDEVDESTTVSGKGVERQEGKLTVELAVVLCDGSCEA